MTDDPFAALGLPARADVSDDDVRAAWRRIAAATHPDRDDGGDPAWFGAAAAAYATRRTSDGRGEALAARRADGGAARQAATVRRTRAAQPAGTARRTGRLAARVAVAAVVAGLAFAAAGWAPSSIGVLAGVLTWLGLTARRDLAGVATRE